MSTILETATRILVDKFDASAEDVFPDAVLEDLLSDSLDWVEFAVAVGDEVGTRIRDEELTDVRTVADFVAVVEEKVGALK
ncbi:MAG: acyl carrier protein [Corynebacteriales bacterium]|nr:acyl carrier protein [Mycobacteriales bacterium]